MKLHEYQAKDLMASYGVSVPQGEPTGDWQDVKRIADDLGGKVVVKAQVLMGGRGKAGGVKLFDNSTDAAAFTKDLIGRRLVSVQNPTGLMVEQVLVVEQVDIAEEYYLSVLLDRSEQKLVIMVSKEGGMDIEEVAATKPEAIVKVFVDPAWGVFDFELRAAVKAANIPTKAHRQMVPMIKALVRLYQDTDADLVEINPVALTTDGQLLAADAKVSIDDSALFRHKAYGEQADDALEDELEAEAARQGIAYVRLGGDIGVIGNGAGLVMCSLDEVTAAGGRPANFLDVGGGAKAERVKQCVDLVLTDENVKGLLINIFGGITRCDEVAKGIVSAFDELNVTIPVVARIEGTAAKEGLEILEGSQIIGAQTMQEAAEKVVAASYA